MMNVDLLYSNIKFSILNIQNYIIMMSENSEHIKNNPKVLHI